MVSNWTVYCLIQASVSNRAMSCASWARCFLICGCFVSKSGSSVPRTQLRVNLSSKFVWSVMCVNLFSFKYASVSSRVIHKSGRMISTFFVNGLRSGIPASPLAFVPRNRLSKMVSAWSSKWWPRANLVAPHRRATWLNAW